MADSQPSADERTAFVEWLESRPSYWEKFRPEDFRVCSKGSPRSGEYANTLLQQLWECWQGAREDLREEINGA